MDDYSDLKNNIERIMQIPLVRRIKDANDKLQKENESLKQQLNSNPQSNNDKLKEVIEINNSLRTDIDSLVQKRREFTKNVASIVEQRTELLKRIWI